MGKLQHNKTIVVDGPKVKAALCGSTNHSWRGLFVQNNNAVVLRGKKVVKLFNAAFEAYWVNQNSANAFGKSTSKAWWEKHYADKRKIRRPGTIRLKARLFGYAKIPEVSDGSGADP